MTSLIEEVKYPTVEELKYEYNLSTQELAIFEYVSSGFFPLSALVMCSKVPPYKRQKSNEDLDDDSKPNLLQRHTVIYSEQYNPEIDDDNVEMIGSSKSGQQRELLIRNCKQCLLFKTLDNDQLSAVINSMFMKKVKKDEIVIKQGEDGDYFYVIESGIFEATAVNNGTSKITKYENGGSFGELALMYNKPRAATVKALTDGVIWALDRNTFRKIVLKHAYNKRKMYEKFLETVPMLEPLQPYEKTILCDALKQMHFKDGETIIKQGDIATGMYFVEKGTVCVYMDLNDNREKINHIAKGGYFGELALVMNQPRAATVKAKGEVTVAFLEVEAFERLLGPCMDVMKRQIEVYNREVERIFGNDLSMARTSKGVAPNSSTR